MRLFVASELPQEMLDALSETSAALRASVRGRYCAPDLFHVTLAFLGELPSYEVSNVSDAVERACRGQSAFSTTLGALGTFGRSSSAVLWQGFADARQAWGELAGAVRDSLGAQGYSYDDKAFLPHVTLMRGADVSQGVLPMPQVARGAVRVVALLSSDLSGGHPRYEALARWELGCDIHRAS